MLKKISLISFNIFHVSTGIRQVEGVKNVFIDVQNMQTMQNMFSITEHHHDHLDCIRIDIGSQTHGHDSAR